MKYTLEQLREAAAKACFYVTPGGKWLRMQWTDTDRFCAADEDKGEDYVITFDEMVEDGEDPEFYHLTRTKIERSETAEWYEP